MKKIIAIFLTVLMVLSCAGVFAACNKGGDNKMGTSGAIDSDSTDNSVSSVTGDNSSQGDPSTSVPSSADASDITSDSVTSSENSDKTSAEASSETSAQASDGQEGGDSAQQPDHEHNLVDGYCTECGEYLWTEGLRYTLNDEKTEYSVSSLGGVNDKDIYIPDTYNDLPVTGIGVCAFQERSTVESVTLNDNIKTIGDAAFIQCPNLKAVKLGSSVESIGEMAFMECKSLESITFFESLVTIGACAFGGCEKLKSVYIPDSVTNICDSAFSACGLESVSVGAAEIGVFAFNMNYRLKDLELREGVVNIRDLAFESCFGLTSVTIPESVESIGGNAFADCPKLVEVCNKSALPITAGSRDNGSVAFFAKHIYEEGESFISEDEGFVFYDEGDDKILLSYVGDNSEVVIPTDITDINKYAFAYCDGLTSVTIPEGISTINEAAFYHCENLAEVVIPEGVESLGYIAFATDTALTTVVLPDSLKKIGPSAFINCRNIKNIVIGSGVESIGYQAFDECMHIAEVYYRGTAEEWSALLSACQPYNSFNYALINANASFYSETEPTEEGRYWHYVDGVPTVW